MKCEKMKCKTNCEGETRVFHKMKPCITPYQKGNMGGHAGDQKTTSSGGGDSVVVAAEGAVDTTYVVLSATVDDAVVDNKLVAASLVGNIAVAEEETLTWMVPSYMVLLLQ